MVLACAAACSTDPVRVEVIRVEGRVMDAASGQGVAGTGISLRWPAGAFGTGGSEPAWTGLDGEYGLVVAFDPPALCDPGLFDLGIALPDGYRPLPADFEPIECVEWTQRRDFTVAAVGSRP